MKNKIEIFIGESKKDNRGNISFFNTFYFKNVKRFYIVENANKKIIRAFHGHMKEGKYVFVTSGKILLCIAPLTNAGNPSTKVKVERFFLSYKTPKIIYIPPKYANGFKILEKNTQVIFYSTLSLQDSLKDDYRFSYDYWGKDVWKNS